MKKLPLAIAVTCTTFSLAQPATADGFFEDVTWVPQVGVQMKKLEFDQKVSGSGLGNCGFGLSPPCKGDLDVDLPSLSLALTAIYQKAYLQIKYEDSADDVNTDSGVPFTEPSTEVQREDYSLTAGYNVWQGLNLFAGYMDGKTTLTPEPFCDFNLVTQTCAFNLAQIQSINGGGNYEQTYEEDGWILGGAYAWKIQKVGTLSLSLAYADLDSSYKDNYYEEGQDFNFEGDATGLSYSLTWSQPLSKQIGYYIDLRRQDYDISADEKGNFNPAKADSSETITALSAGIQVFL